MQRILKIQLFRLLIPFLFLRVYSPPLGGLGGTTRKKGGLGGKTGKKEGWGYDPEGGEFGGSKFEIKIFCKVLILLCEFMSFPVLNCQKFF